MTIITVTRRALLRYIVQTRTYRSRWYEQNTITFDHTQFCFRARVI